MDTSDSDVLDLFLLSGNFINYVEMCTSYRQYGCGSSQPSLSYVNK